MLLNEASLGPQGPATQIQDIGQQRPLRRELLILNRGHCPAVPLALRRFGADPIRAVFLASVAERLFFALNTLCVNTPRHSDSPSKTGGAAARCGWAGGTPTGTARYVCESISTDSADERTLPHRRAGASRVAWNRALRRSLTLACPMLFWKARRR
jgi:hypothetical protein